MNTVVQVKPAVGMGATIRHWSDATAVTITACTASSVTVQEDTAVLMNGPNSGAPDALQCDPGGFAGHTSGTQRWECAPNPNGGCDTFTLRKNGRWVRRGEGMKNGTRLTIGVRAPHYDFNF